MNATRTPIAPAPKWIQTNARQRLEEKGLELPHLVVGATPDDQIVVRCNSDADVMRSFGEDRKNVADELTAPPEWGDTTH